MFCLRVYQQGDEGAIMRLVGDVLVRYGLKTDAAATDKDILNIGESYTRNGGVFKVLECDGRIVGSYGLYRISPTVCELRKMYLYEEFRGKGFGKMMMEDAFIEAKGLGFSQMILETNSCLKEALELYKKYGFEEYEVEHLSQRCDMAMKKML